MSKRSNSSSRICLPAILFTEPVMDLRTAAAGGNVTEIRIQPVTAWIGVLLGDDFNLVTHAQLISKRHDAPANFRPNAAVSDIAMNMVSEVERRRAHRQVDNIAFRRKHVNAIVEYLTAHFIKHFARVSHLFLPRDKLTQPGNTAFVAAAAAPHHGSAFFVLPMRRDAQFGIFMHLACTDLYFQRFTAWPQNDSVNRLITVWFWVSDVVVKFIRQMAEMGMYNPERCVTIL